MEIKGKFSKLPKDALLKKMEAVYADAKPMQDALADKSLEILELSAEVFGRIIARHLPTAAFHRTRVVTELSASLNCLGQPSLELDRRLNKFAAEGIEIVRVEFDELQHRFLFHAAPTGSASDIPEE